MEFVVIEDDFFDVDWVSYAECLREEFVLDVHFAHLEELFDANKATE